MWNLQKHEHQKYFWNYVTVLQVKSSSGRKLDCKQQWKLVCAFVGYYLHVIVFTSIYWSYNTINIPNSQFL